MAVSRGIHPAHRRGGARHLLDQNGEDQHHLDPERVVAAQDQHQPAERLVGQHLAETGADRGRSHRELVGRQDQQVAQRGADKQASPQQADIFEVEVEQPAAEQGPHHGAGALQHHQQGDVAPPLAGPGEFDHQGSAGRIEQTAPQSRDDAGEDQLQPALGIGQAGKPRRPQQQHAAHYERPRAELVRQRAAQNAQPLLGQLAQSQRQPDHPGRPTELIHEAQADHGHHHEEPQDHQQGIQRQKPPPQPPRPLHHDYPSPAF